MKRYFFLSVMVLGIALTGCDKGPKPLESLDNETDKVSYALGCDIARAFTTNEFDINPHAVAQGMSEFLEGKSLLTDQEVGNVLSEMNNKMRQKQMEKQMAEMQQQQGDPALAAENLQKSEEWLAANAQNPGVKSTESGLQYEIITEGTGASPKASDVVTVHYKGTLTNGETFDSSYDRGQPATFPLPNLIRAWQEAIPMMKVGGKRKLYVHPDMGYGPMGSPPSIGPNEALIFEIELLGIGGN